MTDLRTAAQQFVTDYENGDLGDLKHYARALRKALEQQEQEPLFVVEGGKLRPLRPALLNDGDKLYPHPPRREPEQEAHIKELEQARERDNIAFKQLLAQRDALLEAQNGKKVRNHEGGTRYQPPVEDAAITALRAAMEQKREQPAQEPISQQENPTRQMPEWMDYDQATDVLTIHGRRYSAAMFGERGFLSPAGTLLQVAEGQPDCVTLMTVAALEQTVQAEPVSTWYGTDWPAHMQLMAQLAHLEPGTDLYTHPPRREWRGFSEGALMGIYIDFDRKADKQWTNAEYLLRLMDVVQVKLKELNHHD